MVCAAIGAAIWVVVATGAWPTTTGAWPTIAGAVKIGAGAKSGGCGAKSGAGSGAGARSGPAGAKRPACALAMAAKMVRATKYDCVRRRIWVSKYVFLFQVITSRNCLL